jgi:K+-transporting ATPase ATPase C chain
MSWLQWLRALRLTLVLWLLTVVLVTLPLLALAALLAPDQAEGSLLRRDGVVVGSRLIGQPFQSDRYLQGRPSAAPDLSPADPELAARVGAGVQRWRTVGIVAPDPALLFDSASGVDPHLSLAAARQQLPRLARERRLPLSALERLLRQAEEGPWRLQAIEPVVNVLVFNLALDQLERSAGSPDGP